MNMKRFIKTGITTLFLVLLMSFTAFAGEWKQNETGWWWQNDDGSYPVNQWQEINGKHYYFGSDGYMYSCKRTPDGYYVDYNGAWITEVTEENRYGLGGRESYDYIVDLWTAGTIEDETSLRTLCEGTFQGSPVYEELIQEIMSLPHGNYNSYDEPFDDYETTQELEEAREAIIENESASFSKKKKAVLRYVEALGINSEGFIIEKKDSMTRITHNFDLSNESQDMIDYIDNLLDRIRTYMRTDMLGDYLSEGEAAQELIDVAESYDMSDFN